jgi:hypothetical protein
MNLNEKYGLYGSLKIHKFKDNKLIKEYYYENLITDDGLNYLLKLIGGDISGGINKLAIGDGNNAANKTDKALNNKLLLLDIQKDYSIKGRINFLSIIPEKTFSQITNYKEAGLVYRTNNSETLITRLVFNDVIYQKPENSLSLLYSLELRV